MAVDPNLLIVKPVSELPSKATPDSNDEFLIYDGDNLKKSTWSNVTDYLASGVNGEAIPTTDPPETGFYRYIVHTAGTYTNFGGIVVSAEDLDGNLVFLEVTDNVAKKVVVALPVASAISILDPLDETDSVSGKAVGDYTKSLFTRDNLIYTTSVSPYMDGNILVIPNTCYIFNGTVGHIRVDSGSLDLTPYITATATDDRFYLGVSATAHLNRTNGSGATAFAVGSLIVKKFNEDFYSNDFLPLFYYDRASGILKSPFINHQKDLDVVNTNATTIERDTFTRFNYHYASRGIFSFSKTTKILSWTDSLFIIAPNSVGRFVRIDPSSIDFATVVAANPTAYYFVAYIELLNSFINGTSNQTVATIIVEPWTSDLSVLRTKNYLPLFYYNNNQVTVSSPFLEEFAHTKALEASVDPSFPVQPWVNKYPELKVKLSAFFQKMFYQTNATADEKTRIVMLGDSLFARHQHTSVLNVIPANNPPTLITKNFGAWFWEKLKGNKPLYRRYDSAGVFTEVGAWTTEHNSVFDDNGDIAADTRVSITDNSNVSFVAPSAYDYFNFIDRKGRVFPSNNIGVSVSGGNGVVQVRLEGETIWNEANGYSFSQLNPTANTTNGIGNTQFQRRIEFKKVGVGTGSDQTITLTNNVASANFFYWGIELIPNGRKYTQLINVARGGHTLNTSSNSLSYYIQTDVYDRKPDLVILEVPLLNMVTTSLDIQTNVNSLIDFVWGDRVGFEKPLSLKNKSNNWADFQVLLVIPHHSRAHYNSDSTDKNSIEGHTYRIIFNAIKGEIIKRGDVPYIDISTSMEANIDADELWNGNYFSALASSGVTGSGYMNDSLHPNDKGTIVWAKEIVPIFW